MCAYLALNYIISSFFYFEKSLVVARGGQRAGCRTAGAGCTAAMQGNCSSLTQSCSCIPSLLPCSCRVCWSGCHVRRFTPLPTNPCSAGCGQPHCLVCRHQLCLRLLHSGPAAASNGWGWAPAASSCIQLHSAASRLLFVVRRHFETGREHGCIAALAGHQRAEALHPAGRVLRWLGLPLALSVLPSSAGLLMAGIALWPAPASGTPTRLPRMPWLGVRCMRSIVPWNRCCRCLPKFRALLPRVPRRAVAAAEVLRKIVSYSLARPARESLFTVVSRAEKYTAKIFLDTVVQASPGGWWRGGDRGGGGVCVGGWGGRGARVAWGLICK